jgi:hypothetical protein
LDFDHLLQLTMPGSHPEIWEKFSSLNEIWSRLYCLGMGTGYKVALKFSSLLLVLVGRVHFQDLELLPSEAFHAWLSHLDMLLTVIWLKREGFRRGG